MILISDVDEIPNPNVIGKKVKSGIESHQQKQFFYYLNGLDGNNWRHPKIMYYKDTLNSLDNRDDIYSEWLPKYNNKGTTASKIRCSTAPKIKNGGWHFGYLGGIEKILYKIDSYSHQENNTESYTEIENLKKLINNINYVEIDSSFSEFIKNNQEKYAHLIHEPTKRTSFQKLKKALCNIFSRLK